MKRVRFSIQPDSPATAPDGSPDVKYGVVEGNVIREVPSLLATEPAGASYPLSGVRLLPPSSPTKIVCVGRNYVEHARELNNPIPEEPLIFLKPPSSLAADGDAVIYPPISKRVDFEGELGVVIGRRARNVAAADALDYVLGFTCVNDVTARDLQKKDGQFTRGKGFDTFCPAGPWLVTKDQVRLDEVRVRTLVDGAVRQDGFVKEMIFPVDAIIAFVTQVMTLEPGDLIATGTPPGVGPMEPGSVVQVEIAGIGTLTNKIRRP